MAEQPVLPETTNSLTPKVTGIIQLKSPGSESNYLDWNFVVRLHLRSVKLGHVLSLVKVKARPATWASDNTVICSFISRIVHHSNLRYIRAHGSNAHQMWISLQEALWELLLGWVAVLWGGNNRSDISKIYEVLQLVRVVWKTCPSMYYTTANTTNLFIYCGKLML